MLALYLAAISTTHDVETVKTYEAYARRFVGFFGNSLNQIHKATLGDYQRRRLGEVMAGTVRKERSFLSGFLAWCTEQGIVTEEYLPAWPKLPKRATGVRVGPQRAEPVPVTPEQVRDFLLALPAWSKPRMGEAHAIRARFVVAYETGLRPATLDVLSVPEHWRPGQAYLEVRDEDDKARFGRRVPLSPMALAALEATVHGRASVGTIFGRHDYRDAVERARKAAGLPEHFAPYDLRHGRIQHLLDAGTGPRAVMALVGHKLMTTTNAYVRGDERAAEKAVGIGAQLGHGGQAMLGAKEGSRTLTGVTPLEPESRSAGAKYRNHREASGQAGAQKGVLGVGIGARPKTPAPKNVGSFPLAEATSNLLALLAGVTP